MTLNLIKCNCDCGNPQNDVLGKISFTNKKNKRITKILTKCVGCKIQHLLKANDVRCKKFFLKKSN